MHTIQDRPVAIDGEVVIRPMMYLALSYDHRLARWKGGSSIFDCYKRSTRVTRKTPFKFMRHKNV